MKNMIYDIINSIYWLFNIHDGRLLVKITNQLYDQEWLYFFLIIIKLQLKF